jgi:hypothetical protein
MIVAGARLLYSGLIVSADGRIDTGPNHQVPLAALPTY